MPPGQPELTSEHAYRAFMIVQLLRSTGEKEFPAPLMACFFWIAAHNGCRQEDLKSACQMSASSVSRNVTWLGPRHRLGHRSGLRLVRRERDPDNPKAWRLYLTPKGRVFTNLLENYQEAPIRDDNPIYNQALKEITDYDNEPDDQDVG